jgi:regulator of protease activity HflC (stomatin/prohibitin superfamily)
MAEIDDLYSALAEADRRGATSDAQALAQAIGEAQAHAGSGTAVQAQVPQATGLSRYLKLGANALGLTAGNVLGIPGGLEDSL